MQPEEPDRTIRARLRPRGSDPALSPVPKWEPGNLSGHTDKRNRIDGRCVEIVFGFPPGSMLPGHLKQRSEECFKNAKLEAEYEKIEDGEYREPRVQYTDHELMTAITNRARAAFISCYHFDFKPGACQGKPADEADLGRSLLQVVDRLRDDERRKTVRNLKIIRS